jgi:hypothetical protein
LAGQVGSFIQRVFQSKKKTYVVEQWKEIEKNVMYYGESVDCNIIMWPVI